MQKTLRNTLGATFALSLLAGASAQAATTIQIQSVLSDKSDEIVMVKDFAQNVSDLTEGEVVIEVLPGGSVVPNTEILDAVDKGLLDGGFAWTHYWSGKHPAAMLFGSPVAGAGVGIDNIAFISWFQFGGGKELYERLWDEMGVNVKGLMLQPVGPEALGWFKEPIETMDDFRKLRFRAPPGIRARPTTTSAWPPSRWAGRTSCPRSRRARSMRPNGAARSPTACSASRRCSSTTTCKVSIRSSSTPTCTSTATSGTA